jgi:hypothetical protein
MASIPSDTIVLPLLSSICLTLNNFVKLNRSKNLSASRARLHHNHDFLASIKSLVVLILESYKEVAFQHLSQADLPILVGSKPLKNN